jgi:hypothetical protein
MDSTTHDTDRRTDFPTGFEPLDEIDLAVPNGWDDAAIEALVDRVLAAVAEGELAAEYRSRNLWGSKLVRYLPEEDGWWFEKRLYDARIGWQSVSKSRAEVRGELTRWLSRETSRARDRDIGQFVDRDDEFVVRPVEALRDD